jgi:putative endonuclease
MRDGQCLVIVEVRYRAGRRLTPAHLTVDRRKQQKLERTAAMFLARHRDLAAAPLRFDVVAIDVDGGGRKTVNWIRDAFRPSDSSL